MKKMVSQVFYRKWRPQTLAEVVGQEPVMQTLRRALENGRVSHAYLFCGPRGTGKTSTARIIAKAVNCLNNGQGEPCNTCDMCQAITEARALDVIEIDAASNTGVDDIRSLREKVNYVPNQARYKVYIIDEVHMLSNNASNALLKTLEEPPAHVIFILATTEAHKILPTVLSRCQRFDFRRLSQKDVTARLNHICKTEGIKIKLEALQLIARSATGSLRDAENLLEQLTTYYGSEIKLQQVQSLLGITGDRRAKELAERIANNDIAAGIGTINSVNNDGLDLRQFNRELVEYLRALMLVKTGSDTIDLTAEDIAELKNLASRAPLEQIVRATKLFSQIEIGFENYSTLPLELALLDCITGPQEEEGTTRTTKPETQPARKETTQPQAKKPTAKAEPAAPASATPEPEPATVTPTSTPEAASDIERLQLNWKQVIDSAPAEFKRSSAVAILRSAGVRPVAVEKNIVSLSFRYPYHKEQIEKLENQRIAEKIISNFLGYPCQTRCISENNHLLKAALKMGAQIIDTEER